jgi:hypothetical protein
MYRIIKINLQKNNDFLNKYLKILKKVSKMNVQFIGMVDGSLVDHAGG